MMTVTRFFSLLLLLGFVVTFTACDKDDNDNDFEFDFDYNFATGQHGWTGDFSDYPVGEEDFYELSFSYDTLPAPLDKTKKALKIVGNNHSDDLFMFVKKKLTGLAANTEYDVEIELELASNAPESGVGIGGGPGSASYLKVGASATEPKKVASDNFYEFNLDKGNQAEGGADAVVIGTLGIEGDEYVYTLIERSNSTQNFTATTNANGELWVFAGVDSGFEGLTTFYITKANIDLTVSK